MTQLPGDHFCHQGVSFELLDRAGLEVAVDFSCRTAILVSVCAAPTLLWFGSLTVASEVWYVLAGVFLSFYPQDAGQARFLDPPWACFSGPRKLAVDLCYLLGLSLTEFCKF